MSVYQFTTPGTRIRWYDLREWIIGAYKIDARRWSEARSNALLAHVATLPKSMITEETDIDVIEEAIFLIKHGPKGLARPERGFRKNHPSTPVLMHLLNRKEALIKYAKGDLISSGENRIAVFGDQS